MEARKRWVTIARRQGALWQASAPRLVGDPAALAAGLIAERGPAALGLDLPLGVPRGFAERRQEADFPGFLAGLTQNLDFFTVSPSLETVSPARPFYPARGIKGMTRLAHAAALGLADASGLSRLCDRATAERPAGAPVFWTLGANQSGKAAISAWRDWLARALAPALRDAMAALTVTPDSAWAEIIQVGFGSDAAGEDRFDSLIGLLGLIGVIDGRRPDFIPADPMIRAWEGWVLGQTALPLKLA